MKHTVKVRTFTVATLFALLSLSAAPLSVAPAHAEDQITLQLRWHHQFQFAGYYAAKAQGYYEEAGLDVTIIAGAPGRKPVGEVLAGRAHYGTANSEVLFERLNGKPLIALASIFQHSGSVALVRQESGILSPQGLVGRKIMSLGKEADIGLMAMLHNEGVDPGRVEFQNSSYDISDLVNGNTDAFMSYLTNEPYILKDQGIAFTVINPATYGIDFYSDILFTSADELRDHPERVRRFREASLRGWNYAMQNHGEIIDLIQSQYGSAKTEDHLRFEADAMVPLILPDLIEIGHMNPGRWKHMADTFVAHGLADPGYSLEGFIYHPHSAPDVQKWVRLVAGLIVALLVVAGIAVFVFYYNGRLKGEIAERVRIEGALLKASVEAEQASRAKSDFLASMSHDLRTPLNAILGLSSVMKEQSFGPLGHARYDEYIKHIHRSGTFLLSLINDILDLSKIEGGGYELQEETLDVAVVVRSSIEQISDFSDKSIPITTTIAKDFPQMRGDERVLVQILNNLISNAVKFSGEDVTVAVQASLGASGGIELSVTDTGIGMSAKDIEHALTPFEQASTDQSRNHEGTGLGLALCDNFMRLFGGALHVESQVGTGTCVTISFPAERTLSAS